MVGLVGRFGEVWEGDGGGIRSDSRKRKKRKEKY